MKRLLKKGADALATLRLHHTLPLHIEFNLSDYCNLNCKGCSHYSPLAPAVFEQLSTLEHSMKKIASIRGVEKIKEVYLIGGETLLYPSLESAMQMARKYFPRCVIRIFTNGILIPKMPDSFWEACKQYRIELAITRYPIKFDYDQAEEICRQRGVKYTIFGDRSLADSFFKYPLDPDKKQNPHLSHFRCSSFGCITVDNGRIFPCSQSACVGHLNRKYGHDFKWEKGDYINVENIRDVKEIFRLRNKPVPFCAYCAHPSFVKYGPSTRSDEEWLCNK